jgi:hypothetical protein
MVRRAWVSLWLLVVSALPAFALQPPKPAEEVFVPISQLPPGQELPAAPFLIGAYAFFLVLLMAYLWTIWRRISKVEADIHALERRQASGSSAR